MAKKETAKKSSTTTKKAEAAAPKKDSYLKNLLNKNLRTAIREHQCGILAGITKIDMIELIQSLDKITAISNKTEYDYLCDTIMCAIWDTCTSRIMARFDLELEQNSPIRKFATEKTVRRIIYARIGMETIRVRIKADEAPQVRNVMYGYRGTQSIHTYMTDGILDLTNLSDDAKAVLSGRMGICAIVDLDGLDALMKNVENDTINILMHIGVHGMGMKINDTSYQTLKLCYEQAEGKFPDLDTVVTDDEIAQFMTPFADVMQQFLFNAAVINGIATEYVGNYICQFPIRFLHSREARQRAYAHVCIDMGAGEQFMKSIAMNDFLHIAKTFDTPDACSTSAKTRVVNFLDVTGTAFTSRLLGYAVSNQSIPDKKE